MQRILLVAFFLIFTAGTAAADYIIIKINVNKLNFFPTAPGGGMGGGNPGEVMPPSDTTPPPNIDPAGGGMPNPGGNPMPQPKAAVDPDARWISAFVELKGKPVPVSNSPMGFIFQVDHKWGKKNWMTNSPLFPIEFGFQNYISQDPFSKEFDSKLNKAKKEKIKNVENFLHVARFALSRGQLKEFHRAMKEAADTDPKNPVVKSYQKVQKELAKPFNDIDPMQSDLLRDLAADKYEPFLSEQKHYCLYAQFYKTDKHTEAVVKRRLAMLEDTLETFYYWFAVQPIEAGQAPPLQPNMPKYRLMAVLTNGKEEFLTRHEQWGSLPMVGDGFTPRRDNFIVLSAKSRIADPLFTEFDKVLTNRILEANVHLQPLKLSISREDLLSGKANELKGLGKAAIYVGAAQASVLLAKTLEDDAERGTVSNEAIRQLLFASEMFPRNVQVPDWMVEGLAAFFETSPGSLYPTIGQPSWLHLISFKHFTKGKQKEAPDILFNVITDRYFRDARKLSAELNEHRDNEHLRLANAEAWELARSTAWSFVYFLAQNRKLDLLFQYGNDLNTLPRDMDLGDNVLQGSFARSFGMIEPRNPRRIAQTQLSNMAVSWFNKMDGTHLDMLAVQAFLLDERAKRGAGGNPGDVVANNPPKKGGGGGFIPKNNPNPGVNPAGPATLPMPVPMPPMPMPDPAVPLPDPTMPNPNPNPNPNPQPMPPPNQGGGQANLANSKWTGSETLKGFGKLSFQFSPGGQVTMFDTQGVTPGRYTMNGNTVSLQFPGNVNYTGTLNGTTITGNATNGQDNWTWNVSGSGAQIQPMPPRFPPKQPMPKFPNPKKKGPFG